VLAVPIASDADSAITDAISTTMAVGFGPNADQQQLDLSGQP